MVTFKTPQICLESRKLTCLCRNKIQSIVHNIPASVKSFPCHKYCDKLQQRALQKQNQQINDNNPGKIGFNQISGF